MKKSSNRLVISVALATLMTLSSNCIAWFEPEYDVSVSTFSPMEVEVHEITRYPYRFLYLKPLNKVSNDSIQKEMLEQLEAQELILVDTKSHSQGNLAQETILKFSGRIFLKYSSIFEKIFAKADDQKCLFEVFIDGKSYIIFERSIKNVYDFKCSELY